MGGRDCCAGRRQFSDARFRFSDAVFQMVANSAQWVKCDTAEGDRAS
jgi:hypothetical protein